MTPEQRRAWERQAHLDAERGVIECRMCKCRSGLDETTTVWRNGQLVFALCDRCSTSHDVLFLTHRGWRGGARSTARTDRCRERLVKLRPTSKRPCRLERGDVRRVPQNRASFVIGYHVCCVRCGFVTPAIEGDGLSITEGAAMDDVSFSSPVRCVFCRVLMHVAHGQLELEEDADVRPARYR